MAKQRFRDVKKGKIVSHETKPLKADFIYATVGQKIKAFLSDSFFLLMPILYIVFYFVLDGREDFAQHRLIGWTYILIPLVIVQTIFMAKDAQTPGYKAYHITLVDIHTKTKPSLGIIIFRNLAALLSLFTLMGWALMFFRKDNKTLHDLLSATAVIMTNDKP